MEAIKGTSFPRTNSVEAQQKRFQEEVIPKEEDQAVLEVDPVLLEADPVLLEVVWGEEA